MSTQSLEIYNRKGTGGPARRRTAAREEYALLAAAKRGDSAAFEILCKQAASTVFHVAKRMTRNNEDAEDVVQESFQLAFIHLKNFKGDSRFSTWLSRIAINAALMKLRKKHRLWDVSLDESAETEQPSSRLDVEDDGDQRISEFRAHQPVYESGWVVEFWRITGTAHLRRRKNSFRSEVLRSAATGSTTDLPADYPAGFSRSFGRASRVPQRQGVPRAAGATRVFRAGRGPALGDALSRRRHQLPGGADERNQLF